MKKTIKTKEKGIYKEINSEGEWKKTYCVYLSRIMKTPLCGVSPRQQRKERGIRSFVEAVKTRDSYHRELEELSSGIISKHTFDTWLKEFIKTITRTHSQSTVANYISVYRKLEGKFKDKNLADITESDVRMVLFELDVVSENRRKKICSNLKTIFEFAVRERVTTINPVKGIKVKVDKPDPVALTQSEVEKLLFFAEKENSEWFSIWLVALYTGLRNGELLGLKKSDIDLENGFIKVERQWSRKEGYKLPKYNKKRIVPIADELKPYLVALMNRSDDLIFHRFSKWISGDQAKYIKDFCTQIEITPIKFHDLRATFITQLLRSGTPAIEVMKIVGHASMKTTDVYVRLSGVELKGVTNNLPYSISKKSEKKLTNLVSLSLYKN